MSNLEDFNTVTDRDRLIAAAAGIVNVDDLPEPVTPRDKLIYAIAQDRKALVGAMAETEESVDDLGERVSDLEENPVSPEQVQESVNNYMDDHPELTHLGFYRDDDGDLCESDE